MQSRIRWVDDIVAAFLRLPPGLRPLVEIYPAVAAVRRKRGVILDGYWHSSVRQILQDHSSDSHRWSPNRTDYFSWAGRRRGRGSGLWGLREQYWPTQPAPQGKLWIDTPEPGYFRTIRGALEELALPDTVREKEFLAEYAALCSVKDPHIGIRVTLYEKTSEEMTS